MKKLWMIVIVAVFFFASCGNKAKDVTLGTDEQATETKCCKQLTEEQKADLAAWEDWDNQTIEKKQELVVKMKECIDNKMAKKAEKCAGEKEMCPEKAEKCAAFKAKWEDWDNLDLEEQKVLVDEFKAVAKKCKVKKECAEAAE